MSFILMLVGLAGAAIGLVMIGFGIPINEFSLGNTLIIAGTVVIVGNLLLIALALLLRQVNHLVALLSMRGEAGAAISRPETPTREFSGAAGPLPEPTPARGLARAKSLLRPGKESPQQGSLPLPERVEMPPRVAGAGLAGSGLADEPHLGAGGRSAFEPFPPSPSAPDFAAPAAGEPSFAPPHQSGPSGKASDMPSWLPSRGKAPERKDEPGFAAGPGGPSAKRVPPAKAPIMPEPAMPAPAAAEPKADKPAAEPQAAPASPPSSEPVSVLKSGVIDGMAYTLYTDGSIEAELAEGVVRFGSIEELRNHLERNGS